MSAAQVLQSTPAAVPLTTEATTKVLSSRTAAGVVGGLTNAASIAGADAWYSQQATLPAAAAGVGVAGDTFAFRQSVGGNATGAGGVASGCWQVFTYKNGAFESQLLKSGVPGGGDQGTLYANVVPLGAQRLGTITLTGALQVVPCSSIVAGSAVKFALVGTTNAGGLAAYAAAIPAPTVAAIVPATSFSVAANAAAAGLIYSYEVIGA